MRDPLRPFIGQRVLARRAGGATILGTLRRVTRYDVVLSDAIEVDGHQQVPLDGLQVRSRSGLDVQLAAGHDATQPEYATGYTSEAQPTSQGRPRWAGPAIAGPRR